MATLKLRYASSPPELELPDITGEGAKILSRLQNGESLVVNGVAGSGKTTLALAAMQLLHDQDNEVMGITPSRVRADYLNTATTIRHLPIARPFITPTALAFRVLKQFASNRRQQLPEPEMLTGSQEEERIQELLEQVQDVEWPDYISPEVRQTDYFRSELRILFATCAQWGISAQDLDALGSEHQVPEWRAAAALLSHYEPSFTDNRWDVSRMQDRAGQVLGEWGEDAALLSPPHLPDWLIVDDLQDCPASTVRLLLKMAEEGTKIFALYNPQVAVETFRGGYPQGAEDLVRELGCAQSTLRNSFRETSGGLELLDPLGKETDIDSERQQKFAIFSSLSSQAHTIAEYLRYRHLKEGIAWKDMAIIARNRAQLDEIASMLQGQEIPTFEGDRSPLFRDNPITASLLSIFNLPGQSELATYRASLDAAQLGDEDGENSWSPSEYLLDEKLASLRGKTVRRLLLSALFGIDSLQLVRLERSLVTAGVALDTKIGEFYSSIGTPRFPLTQVEMIAGGQIYILCHRVLTTGVSCLSLPPLQALEKIWILLDLQERWRDRALNGEDFADNALDVVTLLVGHAQLWSRRHLNKDMHTYCRALANQMQPEDVNTGKRGRRPAVALETVFSAAGRTWDTCVVIGMQDGQWPVLSERGSMLRSGEISDLLHANALLSPSGKLQIVPGESRSRALEIERSLARCALSRARKNMLVTARLASEEAPSVFFDNLCTRIEKGNFEAARYLGSDWDQLAESASELTGENSLQEELFPSLRSLVGHLRAVLARETDEERRQQALETLAYLSSQGVRFANPDTWRQVGRDKTWWTNPAGLKPAGRRVGISPSGLEQLNRCELRWLLGKRGGEAVNATGGLAWGTLVHTIAEKMTDSTLEERLKYFYENWPQDTQSFFSRKAQKEKEKMVERLSHYLDDHQTVAITELSSYIFVQDAAVLAARIDRLEPGEEGIRIIDFKTGTGTPTKKEVPKHLQLACYQLVLEAILAGEDKEAAEKIGPLLAETEAKIQNASLVFVSKPEGKNKPDVPKVFSQYPLTNETKSEVTDNILQAVQVVSGAEFKAIENGKCRSCSLRSCCPLMNEGEQVL